MNMIKKSITFIVLLFLCNQFSYGQQDRIKELERTLDSLSVSISGLSKKVDFDLSDTNIATFIKAIASNNKINVSVETDLSNSTISQNFTNATVSNVFLHLCKEYNLTLEVLGSILSFKRYEIPIRIREIEVSYDKKADLFSVNFQNDDLYKVLKKITDVTGKNLVFAPEMGNQKISSYIREKSFESAIDKIAFANNLIVTKTKDNYYLFEKTDDSRQKGIADNRRQRPPRYRNDNFFFQVKDTIKQLIDVDFKNSNVASVIQEIGYDLNINMFTSTPLSSVGNTSVKANNITYDLLLTKILENTKFSFKKKNGIYYFGEKEQTSVLNAETIPLIHRSIEIMNTPIGSNRNSMSNNNQSFGNSFNTGNQNVNNQNFNQNNRTFNNTNRNSNRNTATNRSAFQDYTNNSEALIDLVPKNLKENIEITADVEQNAFVVSGNAQKIEEFKAFLKTIDKPVSCGFD